MAFVGSIFKKMFGIGGGKKESIPVDPQLQPLLDLQKKFADYGFPAAQKNFGKSEGGYDTALDFYKTILTGDDDQIMNLLNASEFTKSADESDALAYNLAGRSGARAAVLGNTGFERQGILQNILEQIRMGAPSQIANIAQGFGNLGAQQADLATGTAKDASNILFGSQEIKDRAADRRAQLIASVIGAAGSAAGAAAAASDIDLKTNIRPIKEVIKKLRQVHGVSFDWNLKAIALGKNPTQREAGILAQQVESVFPELVIKGENNYRMVNYTTLTALVLEAMKELQSENASLKLAAAVAK